MLLVNRIRIGRTYNNIYHICSIETSFICIIDKRIMFVVNRSDFKECKKITILDFSNNFLKIVLNVIRFACLDCKHMVKIIFMVILKLYRQDSINTYNI